jgi:hypothetical protein
LRHYALTIRSWLNGHPDQANAKHHEHNGCSELVQARSTKHRLRLIGAYARSRKRGCYPPRVHPGRAECKHGGGPT